MTGGSRRAAHWSERLAGRLSVWIDHRNREVRLDLDGVPSLRVDAELNCERIGPAPWLDATEEAEIRVGPAWIPALALRGRWVLHASAVMRGEGAILFAGESGAGKSTIARDLERLAFGWRRLTDDLSPVEERGSSIDLHPDFPQLKLAEGERWNGPAGWSVAVEAIVVLEPSAGGSVRLRRLAEMPAAEALLAQTAAARMFDEVLLGRHLDFAAKAARAVSVFALEYPHRRGAVEELAAALERGAAAAGGADLRRTEIPGKTARNGKSD